MPARSRVQTIALPMRTLWNKGALTLGNAAPDHFAGSGALAGFQIGDLSREVAVFVGGDRRHLLPGSACHRS